MKIDPLLYSSVFPERCQLDQCKSRCCHAGAWVDVGERQVILDHQDLLVPFLREASTNRDHWFGRTKADADFPSGTAVETGVVDGACAFFNPLHGCVLQKAATEAGMHRWHLKPRFCVLFPLVVQDGVLAADESLDSIWCMQAQNRSHGMLQAVEAELHFVFGDALAVDLLQRARALAQRRNGRGDAERAAEPGAQPDAR